MTEENVETKGTIAISDGLQEQLKCKSALYFQFDGEEPVEFLQFNDQCSIIFNDKEDAGLILKSETGKTFSLFVKSL